MKIKHCIICRDRFLTGSNSQCCSHKCKRGYIRSLGLGTVVRICPNCDTYYRVYEESKRKACTTKCLKEIRYEISIKNITR